MSNGLLLDAHRITHLVDTVLVKITEHYVIADTAMLMAQSVRERLERGDYAAITDLPTLCHTLTEHLRAICHDKHLRVVYHTEPKPLVEGDIFDDADELAAYWTEAAANNHGWDKAERLPGNIGYLRFSSLDEAEETAPTIAAALAFVARTSALILDIRRHTGGAPTGVAFLCSYFVDSEPVHLNDIRCRTNDSLQQYWTLPTVPGARYLDRPVYILTSRHTFSAGEGFAYNLQTLGRAIVVGETTAGGANPVEVYRIDPHIDVRVPTCQAINPITKTNWEGVGVVPNIAVAEDEALEVAYRGALQIVGQQLDEHHNPSLQHLREEVREALDRLDRAP